VTQNSKMMASQILKQTELNGSINIKLWQII
jgi:hypothetical protein